MLRRLRIENFVLIREADLSFGPQLNAVTGETGAGKTILAQAIGLLLGAPGDAGYVGPGAEEAYVEAELDLPPSLLDEEGLEGLAELRPADEEGLVLARRVFADGRTRAYAWGRAVAREDLAAVGERLIAMSGQFEQRRLARPAYQLDVLDGFVGEEQAARRAEARTAWRELAAAEERRRWVAEELRTARRTAAEPFAEAVAAELQDIGMHEGEFHVELTEAEPDPTGSDRVAFLVRPNAGLPFAPVAETASGGELSRIALAIAAVGGGPTMVFDEIDAGIGGETANAVGRTLRRLAERAQVVTITHLPQIASLADRHFNVEKVPGDPTHTRIEALADDERRAELERMLGGAEFLASVR